MTGASDAVTQWDWGYILVNMGWLIVYKQYGRL